jgi:rhomboid family GlyGly-CTERM serine protease
LVRQKEKLMRDFPPLTALIAASAVFTYLCPPLAKALVYDRGAILGGEAWRLITCPLVNFSADHLFFNLLVFAAAGSLIERKHPRLFMHLCIAASMAGSLYILLALPGMSVFGGLSGIATMAVVFLALDEWDSRGGILWLAVLMLTAGKVTVEWILGVPIFADAETFVLVPAVHLAGGLVALGAHLTALRRRKAVMPSG